MNIKSTLVLLAAFFLTSSPGICQKIDSLKSLLGSAEGNVRSAVLLRLAYETSRIKDYPRYLEYAKQGYENALRHNDTLNILKGARMTGQAYRYLANLTESLKAYMNVSSIIEMETLNKEFADEHYNLVFGMAITYTYLADYDQALEYDFKSLELSQKAKKTADESLVLNNLGMIYYKLKDYSKALEYFRRSIELKGTLKNYYGWDMIMLNAGLSYAFLGDYSNAQKTVDEVLKGCGENCNSRIMTQSHFANGIIHFGLGDLGNAESSFSKSYLLAFQQRNVRMQFDNIEYLIQIYLAENRLANAKAYLKKAEDLITSSAAFNLELIKIYSRFYQYYSKVNDYRLKSHYQEKYIQLKDSIYNEELTTNLMKVEAEYLERENKARIASQAQVLALNRDVIKKQRLINLFVGCIAALLVGVALLLLKNVRQKHRINLVLNQRVRERTSALEQDHGELKKQIDQRDLVIDRVSREMKSCIATLKGICSTGLKDLTEPKTKAYMRQVQETYGRMADVIKSINKAEAKEPAIFSK